LSESPFFLPEVESQTTVRNEKDEVAAAQASVLARLRQPKAIDEFRHK